MMGSTHERGRALLLGILFLGPFLVLGVGIFQVWLATHLDSDEPAIHEVAVELLAEAAIAESIASMRASGVAGLASEQAPMYYGGGRSWVVSKERGAGVVELHATAILGDSVADATAIVRRVEDRVFPAAIQSLRDTELIGFCKILAGDSPAVFAGKNIYVDPRAVIQGDTRPGPQGIVLGHTENDHLPLREGPEATEQHVPEGQATSGIVLENGAEGELESGTHHLQHLRLGVGARLVLQGPARIVLEGDLTLRDGSSITIQGRGDVALYLKGELTLEPRCKIERASDSEGHLYAYLEDQERFHVSASAPLELCVHAPRTHVILTNDTVLRGALFGRQVTIESGAELHYDARLGTRGPLDHIELDVLAWRPAQQRALTNRDRQVRERPEAACVSPSRARGLLLMQRGER